MSELYGVITNRNGREWLLRCLPNFLGSAPGIPYVMVDNASDDGSAEVAAQFPVKVLCLPRDRGYAAAANAGILYWRPKAADIVGIFSNDILIHPQTEAVVRRIFGENPELGILGVRKFRRNALEEFEQACAKPVPTTCRSADLTTGCLLFLSGRMLEHIGLFDEAYYMYGEDNDLICRGRRAGFMIAVSELPVWHHGAAFSERYPELIYWYSYRNLIRLALRCGSLKFRLRLLATACNYAFNPRTAVKPGGRRLHPYGWPGNSRLLARAIAWNLRHLRETIRYCPPRLNAPD